MTELHMLPPLEQITYHLTQAQTNVRDQLHHIAWVANLLAREHLTPEAAGIDMRSELGVILSRTPASIMPTIRNPQK